MQFSDQVLGILVVAALALGVVLAAVTTLLAVRLRRLRRAYAAALDAEGGEDVFVALERHLREVEQLRSDVTVVHRNTEHLRDLIRRTVSRVGVVRYDAFDDMGGALSFSMALLDEQGHGVVVSAINGRTEARTYAKPVVSGTSEFNLSPEESSAIEAALSGERVVDAPRRRRRDAS